MPSNYRPISLLCQAGKSFERFYINDIVNELRASVRLFADDTSLYIVVENPNTAALTLNNDLNFVTSWADDWLVKFKPKLCLCSYY